MRVVQAAPARRSNVTRPSPAASRAALVERAGLVVTSLVLALGLWLVYAQQIGSVTGCDPIGIAASDRTATSRRPCVNLSSISKAVELLPALSSFDEPAERAAVARALVTRLTDSSMPAIDHVGALASVTMPAATIQKQSGFVVLNERLRQRGPGSNADVPVLGAADIAALKPAVIVRTPAQYGRQLSLVLVIFMLAFWCAHAIRWWFGTTGDAVLLPAIHLLTGLGLMMMIALRDPVRDTVIAQTFVMGILAGTVIWTALSFIDFEQPGLRRLVLLPLGLAVGLASVLLVAGTGPAGSGAKVNLLGIQPVEIIRLLVVFALAAYFARRWQFLREFSESLGTAGTLGGHMQLPRWKDVRPLALTIATLLTFFFLQKDLGPALVLSVVFLGLYGLARGRVVLVAAGFGTLVLGFWIGHLLGVPGTVAQRVAMWLDPWENALTGGDQIAHGLWALASGGALGLGPGVGDPRFIPAGHTDLILPALGEDIGFVGVVCALVLLGLIVLRMLAIGKRAPGDYTAFLTAGLALALAAQTLVIAGGVFGLLPLAGVVTPFLSFGRSSMVSNFAAVAICAAIARRRGPAREQFVVPLRTLKWTLATALGVIAARAAFVEVIQADRVAARANLTRQADGGYRYQYNPRLVAAAALIPRGTIFDRNGLPLASEDRSVLAASAERYRRLGVTMDCPQDQRRCYPLGSLAFHLLGDAEHQLNWAARNTSFVEQQFDVQLRGFDDHARTVQLKHPQTNTVLYAVRRDYSELLPLVRHKGNRRNKEVRRLLERDRDLQLTIDAGLQVLAARALRKQTLAAGTGRGAVVVVDPANGNLLASASYPWPEGRELRGDVAADPEHLLDRARYGLYPPGSTFKLVTAVAALRSDPAEQRLTYQCERLPDGRVGGRVRGVARPIRDDAEDHTPHGTLDMHRALVVSCNAYFANLARKLGSKALAEAAAAAQISVAPAPAERNLTRTLAFAGYGQGDVVATPLRMARATAALASDGMLRDVIVAGTPSSPETRWVNAEGAALLRRDMREVVTSGTGRSLASYPVAIAGKTGTAEVDGRRSHAWFVGFAPYGATPPRIAFAVIVENAGYGGRVAAPLAADVVGAASARGLLKPQPTASERSTSSSIREPLVPGE